MTNQTGAQSSSNPGSISDSKTQYKNEKLRRGQTPKGDDSIPRRKRVWYPGAIYHVMSRGNCKQPIYHDNEDYEYFLSLLDSVRQEKGFSIHAMCLMKNHFHLLIETREKNIGEIMKPICQHYTQYYNRKYNRVGHLFQGRYKSSLIESESQFLMTSRYIHLNPVKAKIVLRPEEYKWTSFRCIIGEEDSKYIERERTLSFFGGSQEVKYRAFVNRKLLDEEREELIKIQKEVGDDEGV